MENDTGKLFKKYRERKGFNSFELSKKLKVSPTLIEYLEDGKTKNPGIKVFRKSIPVLELNPYELYELITGEVYTEQPKGSLKEEMKLLKERNEELKANIEEYRKREDRYLSILENFSISQKTASQTPIKGTGELRDHPRKVKPRVESKAPG